MDSLFLMLIAGGSQLSVDIYPPIPNRYMSWQAVQRAVMLDSRWRIC